MHQLTSKMRTTESRITSGCLKEISSKGEGMKLNKKTSIIIAVAGALLLTVAAVAFSHGHRWQGPPRDGDFRDGRGPHDGLGPLRDLNLTADQKTQVKKIKDSFEESNKALFDQMRTLHGSEPDPMSGNFDEAAVRTAAEARAKIQVEIEVSHAKMMSQIAGVLTAEQKTQLAARRQKFERQGPPPPPPGATQPQQ
jgi:Spy/CpxP family protein refolding chaperone